MKKRAFQSFSVDIGCFFIFFPISSPVLIPYKDEWASILATQYELLLCIHITEAIFKLYI